MTAISDQQLLDFNTQGLIPGPSETEEQFLKRANYCLNIKDLLKDQLGGQLPFTPDTTAASEALNSALPTMQKLYGINPHWLPIYFSNHQLFPWHGGSAWIFQLTESSPTTALLQLRKAFYSSKTFLRLYSRDEVVAHEAAHVGRMLFEEPRFEELLAYRSSSSPFRRWLGPIVQSGKESAIFVFLLFLLIMADIFILTLGSFEAFAYVQSFKLFPVALIGLALVRLWRRHRQFRLCRKNLAHTSDPEALIYRLTDKEIATFSRLSPEKINDYVKSATGLRWRQLRLAYFANVL